MRELPMAVKALHAVSRIRFGSASQVRPSVASASTKSTCRMSEYLTDRRTGKDSLTSVTRRKARPPRSGTGLVWYRTFPSVPPTRAVGGLGLVPDVPCPHREASLTPRRQMEDGPEIGR